jgi:MFS family permease
MTGKDQYKAYLASRYFSGFCGTVVSVLGPRYLTDLFFLHQRGRAFTILHLALNFGASAGPTFSGFFAADNYWPVEYWWSVGLTAVAVVLIFLFLEETGYDRTEGASNPQPASSFLANRVRTFFPGSEVVKSATFGQMVG